MFKSTEVNLKYWLYSVEPSFVVTNPPHKPSNSNSVIVSLTLPSVSLSSNMSDPSVIPTESPLIDVAPAPLPDTQVLLKNCRFVATSTAPNVSEAAALAPTMIAFDASYTPFLTNGAGYSAKSNAIAPVIVAPNMATPVPIAAIFLIDFFNLCITKHLRV